MQPSQTQTVSDEVLIPTLAARGIGLTSVSLASFEDEESDFDYDSETDDEIVVPAPISKALKKKYCDLRPRSKKLFGAFLRDNVGELMPFDSKAEENQAVNLYAFGLR